MFSIINSYIGKLKKEDVKNFALKKGANLSDEEVSFTYEFIKKEGMEALKNPSTFNIDRYKRYYSEENFRKIKQVFNEYYQKFF